jgi:hypothetical protein
VNLSEILKELPVENLQAIIDVIKGKRKFGLDLVPVAVNLVLWATKYFTSKSEDGEELLPIGAAPIDEGAILSSLAKGEVVLDDAKGGGVLLSLAVAVLAKVVSELLADYFKGK